MGQIDYDNVKPPEFQASLFRFEILESDVKRSKADNLGISVNLKLTEDLVTGEDVSFKVKYQSLYLADESLWVFAQFADSIGERYEGDTTDEEALKEYAERIVGMQGVARVARDAPKKGKEVGFLAVKRWVKPEEVEEAVETAKKAAEESEAGTTNTSRRRAG